MHVIVVACHHPLFCCMDASLFTTLFGTYIPTPFSILNEKCFYTYFTGFQIRVLTSPTPFYSHVIEPHLSMKRGMHMQKYKMASNK